MDLGECSKIHDIALVADYNNAAKDRDYFYDVDVRARHRFVAFFEHVAMLSA